MTPPRPVLPITRNMAWYGHDIDQKGPEMTATITAEFDPDDCRGDR